MSYEIGNPQMLWLLLFAPVALALMAYSGWSNRNALAKFGSKPTTGQSIRGIVSAILLVCGIVFLALGCADLRWGKTCLLYTSPSPRDATLSRMPSSA